MSAETQIQTIIDNAIAKASDLIDEAKGYSEAAQTAAASYVSFNPSSMGTWTTTPVPAFEPDEDLSALFRSEFDNAYNKYLNLISDKIANFLVAYFPDVSVALQTAERWLVNTINNGGTGLPVDVENAIWERNRAKELVEAQRMEDEAVAAVAAKGFSLPTGALSARLLQVQQAASDKVSTQARDVAIKQAELELENIRFAVGQALAHRRGVIQSALEYMRAWMMAPDAALKEADGMVDAKGSLFKNSLGYYEVMLRAEDMRKQRVFKEADLNLEAGRISTHAFVETAATRARAAVAIAEAAGRSAAAALSGLNSIAHIGNVTNQ